ncbi:MAG TPA: DegT/DnrJ/EryC1/StrS family aminotransferase, partial [Synechococcales bacterium UBA12195]|nr:DegT/DnrJ/EryC1/StrS family aminotransferase [Synechococcales bacterium UBA12195]
AEVLSLPIFPEITATQQEQVIQALGGVSRVIPLGGIEDAAQAA